MAVITKTIGTAGGRDYSTITAWVAALPANLVTDGNSQVGQCYNDSAFLEDVAISGHTTDATHTLTLTTGPGQSFRDNANVQTNALKYNQSNGVALSGINANYHVALSIAVDMTVSNLQITGGRGTYTVDASSGNTVVFDSLILQGPSVNGQDAVMQLIGTNTLKNCVVMQQTVGGRAFRTGYSNPNIFNCTIVAFNGDTVFRTNNSTPLLNNNAFFGWSGLLFADGHALTPTGSNNCSDLNISTWGTGNLSSKTFSSQFQNTTLATLDLRAKAGGDIIDAGLTDTSHVSPAVDIVGTTRPSGSAWDIGAWELVSAAAATPTPPQIIIFG